jgi:hypothetical protein
MFSFVFKEISEFLMLFSGGGSTPLTHRLSMKIDEFFQYKEINSTLGDRLFPDFALPQLKFLTDTSCFYCQI